MYSFGQVGGLQLRPSEPLPEDLATFLNDATEGAVLVSFGASLKVSQMSEEKTRLFVEAFSHLGLPVIWKWEGEILGLPSHVLVRSLSFQENIPSFASTLVTFHICRKWLPQQDILGHKNLKVFPESYHAQHKSMNL